jgi:hypothetical protein
MGMQQRTRRAGQPAETHGLRWRSKGIKHGGGDRSKQRLAVAASVGPGITAGGIITYERSNTKRLGQGFHIVGN